MRRFMLSAADALDIIAAMFAIGALAVFVWLFPTANTDAQLVSLSLLCLMLAAVPACLAAAVHRIVSRG